MALVLRNYVGLLGAILLPLLGFYVFDLSSIATGAVAMLSAGLTLGVGWSLSRLKPTSAKSEALRHFGIQKQVLLIFVAGGLLSSMRFFLAYKQSILSVPLVVVTSGLWLLSVFLIFRGLVQSSIELKRHGH